jgi:hypothetical protein
MPAAPAPQPAAPADDDDLTFGGGGVKPGWYDGRVVSVEPKTIVWQDEERPILEWRFQVATDEGVEEVEGTTSRSTDPRSKLHGWVTALIGRAPKTGETLKRSALVGLRCTVHVEVPEGKTYPKVAAVLPPRSAQAATPVDDRPAVIDFDEVPPAPAGERGMPF